MLAQIAGMTRIDLATGIIEVMIFDKGAELRRPIVVRACDDLPGEVRMIFPSATVKILILALNMKFAMNAPVLIYIVRLLLRNTSPAESFNVKSAPPRKPL
jgi:hypothetical protein